MKASQRLLQYIDDNPADVQHMLIILRRTVVRQLPRPLQGKIAKIFDDLWVTLLDLPPNPPDIETLLGL